MPGIESSSRLMAWLRRYLPAEGLSLTASICCTLVVLESSGSLLLAAIAGAWAENLAYYGAIVVRELRAARAFTPLELVRVARNLLIEFGPAELLDNLVRPAALAASLAVAPSAALGALVGKLSADLVFYIPTILSYELLRRREQRTAKRSTHAE